ncbi:Clavaminate synthase-like protein [Aureobasidium pullulans]|nr:Clavaminate synthase-like protein [Aureobasidium pullulans]
MSTPTVTTAVGADNLTIPLIDFSAFQTTDPTIREATAKAILSGFQTAGFIYIRNHGIDKAAVEEAFKYSADFFKRPVSQKEQLAWTTPEANRGYVRQGREKTTDVVDPSEIEKQRALEGADLKESLEIGREGVAGLENQWPDRFDEDGKVFREKMLSFFEVCKDLHVQVMQAIAVGLGIDEHWFDKFCNAGDNTLRLLHYPTVSSKVFAENKNSVRAGAHTDYGSITLLFQDARGGLQVLSPMGTYVNATPIADTIVVNAGDLLARWSNDTIKSTKHRVVEPPVKEDADFHPARYSMAYFCNPNFDRFIDAIPGTFDEAKQKKYQGVNSGDYLVQRLTATY